VKAGGSAGLAPIGYRTPEALSTGWLDDMFDRIIPYSKILEYCYKL
jgi:hypothetical protein